MTAGRFDPCTIGSSYVYMLLCQSAEGIHVKVGISDNPLGRLKSLLTACPIRPGVLAVARLSNRRIALQMEGEIHRALRPWRHSGREWFLFLPSEKSDFNAALQCATAHFSKPLWPVKWTKMSVRAILAAGERRRRRFAHHVMKRGRAFRDFYREQTTVTDRMLATK